jgi:peptide/nickel transport system permease protein
MSQYLIRRVLQAIPLLFLLSIFVFLLIHALPGGPDQVFFNPHLDAAGRAALRARFGLDQPLYIQYLKWLGNTLRGDFGFSFDTNQPVADILAQRFPNTLELFAVALGIALILAIALGVIAALRQNTATDYALTVISYFGISMPAFLLGLFLQDIFGVQLHLLPVSGTATLGVLFTPFDAFLDHLLHLVLPTFALSLLFIAQWSRYMRSSMVDVVKQDYMRTARAKGVATSTLVIRHALRNAVIPLITVVAIDFGSVVGGTVITEGIFNWPGVGLLFLDSLENRDYPVLLAMLIISGVLVITFNLVADILYGVMDPRIRYS